MKRVGFMATDLRVDPVIVRVIPGTIATSVFRGTRGVFVLHMRCTRDKHPVLGVEAVRALGASILRLRPTS